MKILAWIVAAVIVTAVTFYVLAYRAFVIDVSLWAPSAQAHESHLALSVEDQKVYEFYSRWMRPKGNFSGIWHRNSSCCNQTDCFPVAEIKTNGGRYSIRVQTPRGLSQEYRVDPAIIESNQHDPRESPDGKSHACIIGGMVACFVEGSGI